MQRQAGYLLSRVQFDPGYVWSLRSSVTDRKVMAGCTWLGPKRF